MALVIQERTAEQSAPGSPLDKVHEQALSYLQSYMGGQEAYRVWMAGQKIHDLKERTLYYLNAVQFVEAQLQRPPDQAPEEVTVIRDYATYKWKPVGVREFICSKDFLNKEQEIYPSVLDCAEELNSGQYVEAVLTGGIGSGKTTLAIFTNAYQVYLLSCMRSPHRLFGLDPSSEILLIFQSITKHLAQGVDYNRFRDMMDKSPYFMRHFPYDKGLSSKIKFLNTRIEVVPVSGSDTAAIGQNVIGGLIDELNYMSVVEKSKSSVDKGTYDQAVAVYNSISRRRKSRFMEDGKMPGILCLVSSKKYPGQFTDQKVAEAEKDPSIYVYDKRVWDIKPKDFGKNGWFHVFTGDITKKPRIVEDGEMVTDDERASIVRVPTEYRVEFEKDIINALREIAGVSTLARHPFFLEVDKVHAAFHQKGRASIFSQSPVDFVDARVSLMKGAFYKPHLPRFVHVDLAISGDSAGLAIGTVTGFKIISQTDKDVHFMPEVWIDGILEVRPPRNSEILFGKIRDVIVALRKMGLNIRWVTFDQFQSTDSQQILRQTGFITGQQSIDTVPCLPYSFTKMAMYEGRLNCPPHEKCQQEILMLEKDTKTGKIDHPPTGSKDCADALAGVVYGLTMRREIWALYKIPILQVPSSIYAATDKLVEKESPHYQDSYEEEQHAGRRVFQH